MTIGDIVREAGTAKRTFYEHFRDKDDCFLQAFEVASELMVGTVVDTVAAEPDPVKRIDVGARAYLDALVAHPDFTKLFLTHMRAGGPQLAERWAAWVDALAQVLVHLARRVPPHAPRPPRADAAAGDRRDLRRQRDRLDHPAARRHRRHRRRRPTSSSRSRSPS